MLQSRPVARGGGREEERGGGGGLGACTTPPACTELWCVCVWGGGERETLNGSKCSLFFLSFYKHFGSIAMHVHTMAHRVQSIASRFYTDVVFTFKSRLGDLCKSVNRDGLPPSRCTKLHANRLTTCKTEQNFPCPCPAALNTSTKRVAA